MGKKHSPHPAGTAHLELDVVPKAKGKKKAPIVKALPAPLEEHARLNGLDNRELLRVLTEVRNGNFSLRMPLDQVGLSGKIRDTLNDIISLNE